LQFLRHSSITLIVLKNGICSEECYRQIREILAQINEKDRMNLYNVWMETQ
jgi:hypothetical protein